MRAHLACLSALLTLPVGASATLLAWKRPFATDTVPIAMTAGPAGVFAVTRQGTGLWLARVDPHSGATLWSRPLAPGAFVGISQDLSGKVVAVTNESIAGRPQVVVRALDIVSGAIAWAWNGWPGTQTSSGSSIQVADRVFVGGSADGVSALAILDGTLGTPLALKRLPGRNVASMEGRRGLSNAFGWVAFAGTDLEGAWIGRVSSAGAVGFTTHWNPHPGAAVANPIVRQPSWNEIWVAAEANKAGNVDIAVAQFEPISGTSIRGHTYGGRDQESLLDATASNAALRTLTSVTDSQGRVRTAVVEFGSGDVQVSPTRIVAKMLVPQGTLGRAFLAGRGWDLAQEAHGGILAFDANSGSDDEPIGIGVWCDVFAFVSSQRLGRTQAMLMRLQPVRFADRAREIGRGSEMSLALNAPAPRGGYSLALGVPSDAPVRLPSSAAIPEGSDHVALPAVRMPILKAHSVPIRITAQQHSWTEVLRIEPTRVRRIQVSPSRAVGCTTLAGQVFLDGPAPRGGYRIRFRSSNSSLEAPRDVVVSEGEWSANFEACTFAVRFDTTANLDALTPMGAVRLPVTILRPELSSLRFEGPVVRSGSSICVIARTTGPAPLGGLDLSVTCTGALRNPGGARMPAGCDEQQIPVSALAVSTPTRSTVTIRLNGRTMAASVMVVP